MENTIGLWFGMGVRCLFTALFGALVLRASCTMLNWFFGSAVKFETITEPVDPKPNTSPEPEDPDSLDRPYRSPTAPLSAPVQKRIQKSGVPEPKYGKAFFICLTVTVLTIFLEFTCQAWLISTSVSLGIAFVFSQLICVAVGSLVLLLLVKIGLPTTFRQAAGIVGCFLLIGLAMATFLVVSILLTPPMSGFRSF